MSKGSEDNGFDTTYSDRSQSDKHLQGSNYSWISMNKTMERPKVKVALIEDRFISIYIGSIILIDPVPLEQLFE